MGFDELRQKVRSLVDPGKPSKGLQFLQWAAVARTPSWALLDFKRWAA